MTLASYRLGDLCRMVKGVSPTLKTSPGPYPLVVTAEYRRSADTWQIEGPAVCIPLVSSTGHGDAALHRVHYQDGKFALANLLVALLPKDRLTCDVKYLYYLLMARKDELLVPLMLGTANVSLKEKDIAGVEINLPPLAEQGRVVAWIEKLAAHICEARALRQQAAKEVELLVVAMAHRADLDSSAKEREGWKYRPLLDVIRFVDDSHQVIPSRSYPNLGIYSFGRGLFHKPPIDGFATSAASLRRVRAGQFIYSRLFAFEGAYGIVTNEFDGAFVSGEYPTFDCDPTQIRVEFLAAYFRAAHVWKTVAAGSKGLGNRRQRVQPAQVLAHEIWLPPMAWQDRLAEVQREVDMLKQLQAETTAELDALLSSILDKAFKGELVSCGEEATTIQSEQVPVAATPYKDDAAIVCVLVDELERCNRPTTEFYIQKHVFAAKHHWNLPVNSCFKRKAAGPWSHDLKQKALFAAAKAYWLTWHDKDLVKGPAFDKGLEYARQLLGNRVAEVKEVVSDLAEFGFDGLGRWMTVLRVVEELRTAGERVSRAAIQNGIDSWPGKRERELFSKENMDHTIEMMVRQGWFVLDG